MEKSSKTTEKLNKTMQESSKTMENRGKWFAVGGAFGEALDTLESKGVLKQLLSVVGLCSCRLVFVGLRCGTIMVAKIRRNFCQYRMLWERLDRRESEEKALLEELLRNFCQYRMLTRLQPSTCHLLVFIGLRCGTIMRKRHCLMVRSRRCIWGGDRETGIEASQRKRHCWMVTRIRSNFCQ